MELLYVSRLCSPSKFAELFSKSTIKPQQQAQKFHSLIVGGLQSIEHVQVTALSDLPISSQHVNQKWWKGAMEQVDGVKYQYLPHLNMAWIGHALLFVSALWSALRWCRRNRKQERMIICDMLNLSISAAVKAAAWLCSVKTAAIVTDIPSYTQHYTESQEKGFLVLLGTLYTRLSGWLMKHYSAYVLLTSAMNGIVNPKCEPSIVIEGLVDVRMKEEMNQLSDKYPEKVVVYAGALYAKYGVKKLLDAFMLVPMENARLWLFGTGDLTGQLRQYEEKDPRIRYFGVLPNQEIIRHEMKATLLVNPRPSYEEFTKYSFPSKNMEYMVSGTAVLTTALPGMPEEYREYVFCFDSETEEAMSKALSEILSYSDDHIHDCGLKARQFVLEQKNNVIQAERLYQFLHLLPSVR